VDKKLERMVLADLEEELVFEVLGEVDSLNLALKDWNNLEIRFLIRHEFPLKDH
ncbi:hypothetical protein BGZ65_010411, partial [Modicella reniformis]